MNAITVIIIDPPSNPLVVVVLPDITIGVDVEVIAAPVPSRLLKKSDKFLAFFVFWRKIKI